MTPLAPSNSSASIGGKPHCSPLHKWISNACLQPSILPCRHFQAFDFVEVFVARHQRQVVLKRNRRNPLVSSRYLPLIGVNPFTALFDCKAHKL